MGSQKDGNTLSELNSSVLRGVKFALLAERRVVNVAPFVNSDVGKVTLQRQALKSAILSVHSLIYLDTLSFLLLKLFIC